MLATWHDGLTNAQLCSVGRVRGYVVTWELGHEMGVVG